MTEPVALVRKDGTSHFTCIDCGHEVYAYRGGPAICCACLFIRNCNLLPWQEKELRERLGAQKCE